MIQNILYWIIVLVVAFGAGKAVSKIKLPAILDLHWQEKYMTSFNKQ